MPFNFIMRIKDSGLDLDGGSPTVTQIVLTVWPEAVDFPTQNTVEQIYGRQIVSNYIIIQTELNAEIKYKYHM